MLLERSLKGSLLMPKSSRHYSHLFVFHLLLVTALAILSLDSHTLLSAQSSTEIAYSDDPLTSHYSIYGPTIVIYYDGPATTFTVCRSGATCDGVASPDPSPAQTAGLDYLIEGGADGDSITVTPGNAGCTIVLIDGFRYCGVAIPDTDGDGIRDRVDSCPSQGSIGFDVDPIGCPIQDSDGDTVGDNVDVCPAEGSMDFGVYADGCPIQASDIDGDGISDNLDQCPSLSDQGFGILPSGCPRISLSPIVPTSIPFEITSIPLCCNLTPNTECPLQHGVRLPPQYNIIDNNPLCDGEARIYAPNTPIVAGELFVVRLELDFVDTPLATTPDLPNNLSPFTLHDSENIQAYKYLAAELQGLDLEFFEIQPSITTQLLRLDTENMNYWEWELRPTNEQSVGIRTLVVYMYAPIQLEDGRYGQQEVYRSRFTVEILPKQEQFTAQTPFEPSPSSPVEISASDAFTDGDIVQDPTFQIIYADFDSLTISAYQSFDSKTLRLRTSIGEFVPSDDFDVLEVLDDKISEGMCLHYVRYQTSPPIPRNCIETMTSSLVLNSFDIFWYERPRQQLLDIVVYYQNSFVSVCSATDGMCNVVLPSPSTN